MAKSQNDSASVDSSVVSTSSSNSSGSRRFLPRLFGGSPSQTPATPPRSHRLGKTVSWGNAAPVPKYDKSKRMLLRSPVPSPQASPQSQLRKQAPSVPSYSHADDSDDDEQQNSRLRKKREEAHVRRLVYMAKQQQSLLTAWFAASNGDTATNLLPPRLASRNPPRKRSPIRRVALSDNGPIDLDSVEPWDSTKSNNVNTDTSNDDAKSLGSYSSQSSGGIRGLLTNILPSSTTKQEPKGAPSDHSMVTLKKSNITRQSGDVESGIIVVRNTESSICGTNYTADESIPQDLSETEAKAPVDSSRNRWIFMAATLLILLAIIGIVVSVIVSKTTPKEDTSSSETIDGPVWNNGSSSVAPSRSPTQVPTTASTPRTADPTFRPTSIQSGLTTSPTQILNQMPSAAPSAMPSMTPTDIPTVAPSSTPTSTLSTSPSVAPSPSPSLFPTLSASPSSTPSSSPTSIFSTTTLTTLVTLSGSQPAEQYGYSVSLSANGKIVAVGSRRFSGEGLYQSGRVQVFKETESDSWQQLGQILYGRNNNDQFGYVVSLSDDGMRLAVSEPGLDGPAGDRSGNVRIFHLQADQWQPLGQELPGEAVADLFGMSLALAGNGQRLAVGSPYHDSENLTLNGQVRVFELAEAGDAWTRVGQRLDGSNSVDWFGWDVDLSNDGRFLVAGAPRNTEHGGYVRCFEWVFGGWEPLPDIVNSVSPVQLDDRFGTAVSLDRTQSNRVAIGAPWKDTPSSLRNAGLVVSYEYDTKTKEWSPLGAPLVGEAANDRMGWSLQLASNTLTVGLYGSNQVSVHKYLQDMGEWDTVTNRVQGDAMGDDFGISVSSSSDGQIAAIGAMQSTTWTGYVRIIESSLNNS